MKHSQEVSKSDLQAVKIPILTRRGFITRVWSAQTKQFWSVWSGPTKHGIPRKNLVHVQDSLLQLIGNHVHAPGPFQDKMVVFCFGLKMGISLK